MKMTINLDDYQVWEDELIGDTIRRVIQNEVESFVKKEVRAILIRERDRVVKSLTSATVRDINRILQTIGTP
jgi:hypothetical protein